MKNKLHLAQKNIRLTCAWVATGDVKKPLACVWVAAPAPRADFAQPPGSPASRLFLCA
jgi:hypothetical protein